jgi:type II secretory pathway pseudopilin PulG
MTIFIRSSSDRTQDLPLDFPMTRRHRYTAARETAAPQRGRSGGRAFTLTELLIVIGIIVLFITLALPAFNLISGSRSVAGAENELGAMLARARMEAIGASDYRGLAIYRDAATDTYGCAIVTYVSSNLQNVQAWSASQQYPAGQYVIQTFGTAPNLITRYYVSAAAVPAGPTYSPSTNPLQPSNSLPYWQQYATSAAGAAQTVDIESGTDSQTLPPGVGVQMITNGTNPAVPPNANGTPSSNVYVPVGVIMFNSQGLLAPNQQFNIATYGNLGSNNAHFSVYVPNTPSNQLPCIPYYAFGLGVGMPSGIGLVAYDKQTYEGQGFFSPTQLPSILNWAGGSNPPYNYSSNDQNADRWLNTYATPLLVNRYNGTIIRSE